MKKLFLVLVVCASLTCNARSYYEWSQENSMTTILDCQQIPSANQMDKAMAALILEEFCNRFYNTCFKDRLYIQGTLLVTLIEEDPQTGNIIVKGNHSYQGKNILSFGRKAHTNVPYTAVLTIGLQGIAVTFYKWSEPDFANQKGYWETGSGFLPYW